MAYLLDTNTVNYIRRGNMTVINRYIAAGNTACINDIVFEEIIRVGIYEEINRVRGTGKGNIERLYLDLREALDDLSGFLSMPYTNDAEALFKTMKLKGMDGRIAAHALTIGYTVVTENTKDFIKVPGLKIVNWAE